MSLLEIKRKEIKEALIRNDGNKTKAAGDLGISIRTLRNVVADDPNLRAFRVESPWNPPKFKDDKSKEQELNTEIRKVDEEKFDTRTVVKTLEGLMTKVTEKECTSETVNAACNCAGRITDLLRLHVEVERMKIRRG